MIGHTGEAGFTLLELLIATTLLGLLSLVLFDGLHFGRQVWQQAQTSTVDANRVRKIQDLLRAYIIQAYPALVPSDPTHAHADFQGDAHSLAVLAPDENGSGSMVHVTMDLQQGAQGSVLAVATLPELANANAKARVKQFQIAKRGRLAFAYYGTQDASGPRWTAQWQDQMRPPLLVRLRLESRPERDAFWPEMIVAPRIAADQGCIYDPLTKYCRGR